jgi:hypothetical protein
MNQNHLIDGWLAQLRFDSRPARAERRHAASAAQADGSAVPSTVFAAPATARPSVDVRPRRRLHGAGAMRPCFG